MVSARGLAPALDSVRHLRAVSCMEAERFAAVCRIPLEFKRTSASVRDIVRASEYASLRGDLPPRELADYLRQHPELVEAWAAYSEDKRAGEGWYFRRPASVGRITRQPPPVRELHYPDPAVACAAFIIGELNDVLDREAAV